MEPNTQRPRILLVDDDRKLCRLLADYLTPLGYDVSAVHTGTEGAELGASEPWHAILLDVMLPGMDGFDVLKVIRKSSSVPVMMLTGRGMKPIESWGLKWVPTIICRRLFRCASCSRVCVLSPAGMHSPSAHDTLMKESRTFQLGAQYQSLDSRSIARR
jgi:CheY-like chemotaxis protein